MPGFHRQTKGRPILSRPHFSLRVDPLVGDRYSGNNTCQQADEQVVIADPDPLLASVRTMQTMAVIVADRPMVAPV